MMFSFGHCPGCHGLDVQGYTQQYDAVVTAIREQADPNHYIQFVGCVARQMLTLPE